MDKITFAGHEQAIQTGFDYYHGLNQIDLFTSDNKPPDAPYSFRLLYVCRIAPLSRHGRPTWHEYAYGETAKEAYQQAHRLLRARLNCDWMNISISVLSSY